ncbi:anhydro-N-acetylmuramic acid kinase [Ferriphaselus sp. R-1]|uniref:anhydro-N-acetylmuramic acid kinase n=1 Tax=Ferriphaselus sp. R-1 TaxID=1485544 RepID=UPI000B496DD5|nr:anhydro-N-acetylmuramic acid kinase [Ferriphaselus sp. R-1]
MPAAELYVGIMSGTSLDGIDCALVDLSQATPRLIASHYQPYPQSLKDELLELHHPSGNELHQAQIISQRLARDYAAATLALLEKAGVAACKVRAIGCHGQTIRHRPEHGYTLQLNNPSLLAELTGIDVIADFRSRDIAAGGQGAPLVPAFHDSILRHPRIHRVILNIGGISNLTDLAPGQPTTGFDCGPGNLLMDGWIARHHGQAYDRDGSWAASGNLIPALLAKLLAEPFFSAPPPKSSGRDLFNLCWLDSHLEGDEAPADVQATLLALTGQSIADAITHHCASTSEIWVCGGGAHNGRLLNYLHTALSHCHVAATDTLGIDADWMEAIAFAWLAQRTCHHQPGNLPEVTGAQHPCILGAIHLA